MEVKKISKPLKRSNNKIILAIYMIISLILIPILIANLTIIVKSFVKPDEVPSFAGYKPFIVLSGSMEPVFYSGDLVLVKEEQPSALKVGDIISFREGMTVTTHRIKEIIEREGQREFITKGDNNNAEDRLAVAEGQLEGKYLLRVSGLGNFAMFMQTPIGMLIFIALPLIAFILYDFSRRALRDRREKKRTNELEEELIRAKQQLENLGTKADE